MLENLPVKFFWNEKEKPANASSGSDLIDGFHPSSRWFFCPVGDSEMPRMRRVEYTNAIYHIVAQLLLRGMVDGGGSMMLVITINSLKVSSMTSTEVGGP